jgi:hypothetical protein
MVIGRARPLRGCNQRADPFDCLADPIDIDTVIPFFTGIEDQRERQRRVLARNYTGNPLRFHVPAYIGIPDFVNEPGSIGEQMAKRDWPLGWPQSGFA